MRFKTSYPGGLSQDQYIAAIISKYTKMNRVYSFSPEQIEVPVKRVIYDVIYVIEEYDDPEYKLAEISWLRKLVMDESFFPRDFLNTHIAYQPLYYFPKGDVVMAGIALENRDVPFPTEQEEAYVNFTQQMSREVIMGICNTTENLIYELQGRDKENIPLVSDNTFADLSQSKKSVRFFKEAIDVKSDDMDSIAIVNNFV